MLWAILDQAGKYVYQETFTGKNFRELVENKIFTANFRWLLTGAVKRCHTPKFRRENLREWPQTWKFVEVFSLKSFPL